MKIGYNDSSDSSEPVQIKRVNSEKKKSKRKLVESSEDSRPGRFTVRHQALDDFLNDRKHLKINSGESSAQHVTINPDEELWIFQCPKNIEVEELLGRKLDLSQPVQVIQSKKGNKEFECKLELPKYENHLTVILPTNESPEAVSVKQTGMITIRERLNVSKSKRNVTGGNNSNSMEKLFLYPTNLKIRHPLLGVDFDKIEIKEEEDDSFVSSSSKKENKRKKDRHHDSSDRIQIKKEPDVEIVVSSSKSEKKRKKRPREDSDDTIQIKQEPDEEEIIFESPKKDKHSKKIRLSDRDIIKIKTEDATPTK